MGPRLISRGVGAGQAAWAIDVKLQWGRGSLAAAWQATRSRTKRDGCFNGAAAH